MFYQVAAVLNFTDEDEAEDFYHDCEVALPKSVTINPGHPDVEHGTIAIANCYHDEGTPRSCDIIEEQETP